MVEFIAEVSSNHNGDLDRCLHFIQKAKGIGCSGAKFQLFRIDELFSKEAQKFNPEIEKRRAWELPIEFLRIFQIDQATRVHKTQFYRHLQTVPIH